MHDPYDPESPATDPAPRQRLVALGTAVGFALAWHLWVGDAHLNPAEEGYLWYPTWRTGLGEVPLRDFQSYDPGRYYACAALGKLFGSGILGLRRAIAVFHGLGILFGCLAARRSVRASWPLVPIGIVLGLWLFPRHKVFEGVVALASVWAGTRVLERPTRARHFLAGTVAGLAAFVGRNLGLYAFVGLALLLAAAAWKRRDRDRLRAAGAFALGVVAGYAPMLVLLALVPGFADGFRYSLELLLRLGANIASPWLWPWQVELTGVSFREGFARIALALVYVLPLVVLPLGLFALARAKGTELARRAPLLAGSTLGVFFLHHAMVRSDASHLAQSIQPTLVAGAALLAGLSRRARVLGGSVAIALAVPVAYAGFDANPATTHVGRTALVPTDMGGDTLRLLPQHADYYTRLQASLRRRVGSDELFVAPNRPAFYCLLGKRAPTWWIYFFVAGADRAEEERIVAQLAPVRWVLVLDHAIAEREELRFQNSYPLVWAHIQASYERVSTPELEPHHLLYRRRE